MESKRSEVESLELRKDILDRIEERVQHTQFGSREKYIEYVLEEIIYRIDSTADRQDSTEIDETDVKNRLKSLGYLDE